MLGDALRLIFAADHEAGDILEEEQRDAPLAGQLDEMRALDRAFGEQHAIIGEDRHRYAPDMREAANQSGAIERLELMKLAAIDDARDHLAHIIGRAHILRDDAIKLLRIELRRPRVAQIDVRLQVRLERGNNIAQDAQRMVVIFRDMIHHAGPAAMEVAAAQILRADDLPRRRLHQRRACKEDRALIAHDHGFIGHGGHIGPARRAAAHHAGDLRNAARGEVRLIVEDAAEMLTIGEHFRLIGQVRAAAVDQIDAGQPVLQRDFLRAQMLLDADRIIGAALHGRVVAGDHHLPPRHAPDTGDDPRARHLVAIKAVGGKLADFQKGRTGIEQSLHPLAWQQLATRYMLGSRAIRTALRGGGDLTAQFLDQRPVVRGIDAQALAVGRKLSIENRRAHAPINSRPISIRRISLVPAPISSSFASRI